MDFFLVMTVTISVPVVKAARILSDSGAGIPLKYVCTGDSVQPFQNIDFDRCNSRVYLNINTRRDSQIGYWSPQNCTLQATLLEEYTDRVFLDQNKGTITIRNLRHFDQGKYVVISKKDKFSSIKETQINVMVAPSKDCKPMIVRLGNKLLASLNESDCGTPVATLYWKGDGGVSDTNGLMLKITPGNESRTYIACIQGPALECAKSPMPLDYCSTFTTEEHANQPVSTESISSIHFIAVIIFLGILLFFMASLMIVQHRLRKMLNGKETVGYLDENQPLGKRFVSDSKMKKVGTEHESHIDKQFESSRRYVAQF